MKHLLQAYRIKTSLLPALAFAMIVFAFIPAGPDIEKGSYPLVYPENFGNKIYLPDDNPITNEGVQLGRMLFYETKLSVNNKISCATCHQQQLAFTDGKAFSEGVNGALTERSAMSLSNLLWVNNLFWDGRVKTLEAQASVPITNVHEMAQPMEAGAEKLAATSFYPPLFELVFGNDSITPSRIEKCLAQFERTLISANSKYDQYLRGAYSPTPEALNGLHLFMTIPDPGKNIRGANCARCHGTVKTFLDLYHNNGLDTLPKDKGREAITGMATDRGRFRVPTLRNIALTAPYMHDGRFKTLEEVVDHYSEHLVQNDLLSPLLVSASNTTNGNSLQLTTGEKKDLIAFLQLLTDAAFITDKRFSNPHISNE